MPGTSVLRSQAAFAEILFPAMQRINPGITEMELYEFRYALDNLAPAGGWDGIELDAREEVERRISSPEFYRAIRIKPQVEGRIVLDAPIVRLTNMLFVGLVTGEYPEEWARAHFYFDIRGFYFLHRTTYFTAQVTAHLGGWPVRSFEERQKQFERCQDIGYQAFKEANAEIDRALFESVDKLIADKGAPLLIAIAGPTAAGKTEIVARLRASLGQRGTTTASVELDNFLTDRDQREEKGIHSLGREALHFALLRQALEEIRRGQRIAVPRYDFVYATSSHDLGGRLKPGCAPIEIEPADVVFVEGNAPFLFQEIAPLIGIKVVYLTDDPIRLKRKWKRDIDYRKKYEPTYFRNRFFRDQFLMALGCYVPQMQACDLVVDTTGAALWATPPVAEILGPG
jgi:uridine kinase